MMAHTKRQVTTTETDIVTDFPSQYPLIPLPTETPTEAPDWLNPNKVTTPERERVAIPVR